MLKYQESVKVALTVFFNLQFEGLKNLWLKAMHLIESTVLLIEIPTEAMIQYCKKLALWNQGALFLRRVPFPASNIGCYCILNVERRLMRHYLGKAWEIRLSMI